MFTDSLTVHIPLSIFFPAPTKICRGGICDVAHLHSNSMDVEMGCGMNCGYTATLRNGLLLKLIVRVKSEPPSFKKQTHLQPWNIMEYHGTP